MPRNSKSVMFKTQFTEYVCACGYKYRSNDTKGFNTILKIHKKACEIARTAKLVENLWKEDRDCDAGTYKETLIKRVYKE